MKGKKLVLVVLSVLTGCIEYETEDKMAISSALNNRLRDDCVFIEPYKKYTAASHPVYIIDNDYFYIRNQNALTPAADALSPLSALVGAGLMYKNKNPAPGLSSVQTVYGITSKGAFHLSAQNSGHLCIGYYQVIDITNYSGTFAEDNTLYSIASFTFQLSDVPDWVKLSRIQTAYPEIFQALYLKKKGVALLEFDGKWSVRAISL
ncbi:hypothetical protein I8H57_004206 [Enterobacter cloacae]|nr:hypothetical protein [Enterobacter cloacae]